MEVTKKNFKEVFPEIKKAIEECSFLSIDTELTGLTTNKLKQHDFDTMDERYLKLKENTKDFLIIQFGICCFTYHPNTNTYTHKDFNCYIFPSVYCPRAPSLFFTVQPSSFEYLSKHGFDFNKCIYEGIPYITPQDEENLQSILKTKHKNEEQQLPTRDCSKKDVFIPDDQKEFISQVHQKINNFVKDSAQKTMNLPPCTGYQRKLIYQTVQRKKLNLDLNTCCDNNSKQYIVVEKVTDAEKLIKLQMKHTIDMQELNDAVGFRKVIDVISSSRKLVIGHNMLLDLFHTIHQFLCPLPNNLREFKDLVRNLFPRLIDTKTLASASVFKEIISSTTLDDVLAEVKKETYVGKIEPAKDFKCYDLEANKMHEAGYDAFITAYCFIKLGIILAKPKNFITVDSPCLGPYMNRPYIMRHFEVQSLNLRGPDPEPSRDHVFYVSFPKEWKTVDLVELFVPYGHIYISWLNDTSALIALRAPEQSVNVKRVLLKELPGLYAVKTYAEFQASYSKNYATVIPDFESIGDSEFSNLRVKHPTNNLGASNHCVPPIPEEEEEIENNSVSKQENYVSTSQAESFEKTKTNSLESPKAKKPKIAHDEGHGNEVSSTEKLFEEPPSW